MFLKVTYPTWQEAVRSIVTQLLNFTGTSNTWTQEQSLDGGLSVNGSKVTNILTATATLDYGSIAAGAVAELTITVTGAVANDSVLVGPPTTLNTGLIVSGFVSAADTVTVRVFNGTAGAIDPASSTWRATVISFA